MLILVGRGLLLNRRRSYIKPDSLGTAKHMIRLSGTHNMHSDYRDIGIIKNKYLILNKSLSRK